MLNKKDDFYYSARSLFETAKIMKPYNETLSDILLSHAELILNMIDKNEIADNESTAIDDEVQDIINKIQNNETITDKPMFEA